jgi:G:T-mismatch repair DNA endonuclease (very short patch repair protein)
LRRRGWRVLRLWEHTLSDPARVAARCRRALNRSWTRPALVPPRALRSSPRTR